MVYPRQKEFSCFDCKFYFPSNSEEFRGWCKRRAPFAGAGKAIGQTGADGCYLVEPGVMWCGDFEKWMGPAREKGTCPYVPSQAEAASVTSLDTKAIERVATEVTEATKTAIEAADKANEAGETANDAAKKATEATEAATEATEVATEATEAAKKATVEAEKTTTANAKKGKK